MGKYHILNYLTYKIFNNKNKTENIWQFVHFKYSY